MARAFYHYTITILEKVSFDPELFKKELEKSYHSLLDYEKKELKIWLQKFLITHPKLSKALQDSPYFSGQELIRAS
jgi:hypothetical protein